MGTEIKSGLTDYAIKKFWGGKKHGVCLQITALKHLQVNKTISNQMQAEGFICLTIKEAAMLCNILKVFVERESKRLKEVKK